jgi:hypothetical protein
MVTPRFREYAGECGSPLTFVVSRNLHRRHLTESQRALLGARLKPMFEQEARQRQMSTLKQNAVATVPANLPERELPQDNQCCDRQAAKIVQVSERSVRSADKVKRQGVAELMAAVDGGKVSVSIASRISALPAEQQKEVVAAVQKGLKPKQTLAHARERSDDTVDDAGKPLAERVRSAFQGRKELRSLCRQLDTLDREIARLSKAAVGFFLDAERAQNHLRQAKQEVWSAQPAHVCPSCNGTESRCARCREQGWITAAMYENPPPTGSSAA